MYVFFFIGGYTYRQKSIGIWRFVKATFLSLYIPYIFFSVLYLLWELFAFFVSDSASITFGFVGKAVLSVLICGGFGLNEDFIGPAWFLCCLFVVRLFFYLLNIVLRQRTGLIAISCIAFFAVGYFLNDCSFLPFKIIPSLTALLFFFVGNLFSKSAWEKCFSHSLFGLLVITVIGSFLTWAVSFFFIERSLILMTNTLPKNPFAVLACGLFACFTLMAIAFLLERIPKVSVTLARLGQCSLVAMGTHSLFRIFCYKLCSLLHISYTVATFPILILSLIISLPIYIVLKNHFPYLVGKKR